jgi:lipopolysaccharide/colanic/teichoic acid biosynthesis glycosyltransferase
LEAAPRLDDLAVARAPRPTYEAAKRVFDLVLSIGALIVLAPALAAIAVAVRLSSPGPVLYRGVRTGLGGRPFRILKFRTMCVDAERLGTTTHVHDPRVTRVGAFLRRFKLDELPQLVNVIAGDMSLVGPRPEVAEHTDAYSPEERLILGVKPGITDLASIRFVDLAAELGPENPHEVYVTRVRAEKNRLRLEYVRRRSFGTDLRSLAATVAAVLGRARRERRS